MKKKHEKKKTHSPAFGKNMNEITSQDKKEWQTGKKKRKINIIRNKEQSIRNKQVHQEKKRKKR